MLQVKMKSGTVGSPIPHHYYIPLSLSLSLFDTMEERYGKLKKFAEKFIICQLGEDGSDLLLKKYK